MKLILTLSVLVSFQFASCQHQDLVVPEAVKASFEAKYPGENDPGWHLDAHQNFEAHFKKKGIKYRADFAANGDWIETENSIKKRDLPKIIRDIIDQNYVFSTITEIEHVQHHSKGEFYDVEFKQKGKNKDVEFDPLGNVLN
jgi:hypothetical protein